MGLMNMQINRVIRCDLAQFTVVIKFSQQPAVAG